MKIAHITDLHIGKHDDSKWEALSKSLNDIKPNFYVITGDITDSNESHCYLQFVNWLKNAISTTANSPAHGLELGEDFDKKICIVPGNHDYFINDYVRVQKEKNTKFFECFPSYKYPSWKYVSSNDIGAFFIGLDSCLDLSIARGNIENDDLELIRKWSDQGRHGKLKIGELYLGNENIYSEEDAKHRFDNSFKILVLHHYIYLSKSRDREPFMALNNAANVLAQIASDDFDLILCGHDHHGIFDTGQYESILDHRAIKRFARAYCIRQLGIRGPALYMTDQNDKLLKKNWRMAVNLLHTLVEKVSDNFSSKVWSFDGDTVSQTRIRRGIKDFLKIDLSSKSLRDKVGDVADILKTEIEAMTQSRYILNCLAPSATKADEKRNGFFIYNLENTHGNKSVSVSPYYYNSHSKTFELDSIKEHKFNLGKSTNLFNTDTYRKLCKEGVFK